MAIICTTPIAGATELPTVDLTGSVTVRYRLEADPDIDASYTTVATTTTIAGATVPFFDAGTVTPGLYVVHTFLTADGPTTGAKVTMEVECGDPV